MSSKVYPIMVVGCSVADVNCESDQRLDHLIMKYENIRPFTMGLFTLFSDGMLKKATTKQSRELLNSHAKFDIVDLKKDFLIYPHIASRLRINPIVFHYMAAKDKCFVGNFTALGEIDDEKRISIVSDYYPQTCYNIRGLYERNKIRPDSVDRKTVVLKNELLIKGLNDAGLVEKLEECMSEEEIANMHDVLNTDDDSSMRKLVYLEDIYTRETESFYF